MAFYNTFPTNNGNVPNLKVFNLIGSFGGTYLGTLLVDDAGVITRNTFISRFTNLGGVNVSENVDGQVTIEINSLKVNNLTSSLGVNYRSIPLIDDVGDFTKAPLLSRFQNVNGFNYTENSQGLLISSLSFTQASNLVASLGISYRGTLLADDTGTVTRSTLLSRFTTTGGIVATENATTGQVNLDVTTNVYDESYFGAVVTEPDINLTSGTLTLNRDIVVNNLTVNGASTILATGGFRIQVLNTLTVSAGGRISRNGINGGNGSGLGIAGAGGALLGATTYGGSVVGGAGATGSTGAGAVSAALGVTSCYIKNGFVNGAGGNGGGGLAGVGGLASASLATALYRGFQNAALTAGVTSGLPGKGGGAGGGNAAANVGGGGGGGGSSGGVIYIFTRNIVIDGSTSFIRCNGGNGGTGGAGSGTGSGGGGGGSGGSGGFIFIFTKTYSFINGATLSNIICNGGNGGAGGIATAGGVNGNAGQSGISGIVCRFNATTGQYS